MANGKISVNGRCFDDGSEVEEPDHLNELFGNGRFLVSAGDDNSAPGCAPRWLLLLAGVALVIKGLGFSSWVLSGFLAIAFLAVAIKGIIGVYRR